MKNTVAIVLFALGCFCEAAPLKSFPRSGIIGTWIYTDDEWPGIDFALTLDANRNYRWQGHQQTSDITSLWDWSNGCWRYDGRTITLGSSKPGDGMPTRDAMPTQIAVHYNSDRTLLKCSARNRFGEWRRITLYRKGE